MPKVPKKLARRALRLIGIAAASLAAFIIVSFAVLWLTVSVDEADILRYDDAITVVDRHGTALRHARSDGYDRRWVELEDISPHLIDSVLAVEDDRFYDHWGVDFRAIVRAAFQMRRKTLRNALRSLGGADRWSEAASEADIDLNRRGETLSVEELARLARSWDDLG